MSLTQDVSPRSLAADGQVARGPISQARHVPGYIYDSPEVFQLEKERIFLQDWIGVGRVEEVGKPGDYKTFRLMGEPFIVSRDAEGKLHALANVCAHRGVEVATGQGNTKEFSCPYHGWLYDLTGKLIGAPYMKEAQSFDPKTCRLPSIKVDVWDGMIFVSFNPDSPPLKAYVEPFSRAFGIFRMQDMKLAGMYETELDCNWKLVNENLMDVYHFETLHTKSFGGRLDGERFSLDLSEQGAVTARYPAAPNTPTGETLVGRLPWLSSDWDSRGTMGHLPPNTHIFGRCDAMYPCTIWPLSPSKTKIILYMLFDPAAMEQPGFAEKYKVYHDMWVQIVEEDRSMVQAMQRNMASRQFRPGPMSDREKTVHNIISGYINRISAA